MQQPPQRRFVLFGIIGVIVVLLILLSSKTRRQSTQTAAPREKVTTENEFAGQNKVSDTGGKQPVAANFTLKITSPVQGQKVTSVTVLVTGQTVPNAEVYVNEIDAKADANGKFSVSYPLEEGENYLIIGASDDNGNSDEQQLMVYQE